MDTSDKSIVTFSIPGEPVGKGRPRFAKVGNFTRAFTPEKTVNFENLVKMAWKVLENKPIYSRYAQLGMKIEARFSIPKSASKRAVKEMISGIQCPTKRPDIDNVVKAVADALNGLAYADDSQIVYVVASKAYSETPETIVTIWEI